jgi:hypothetical protein
MVEAMICTPIFETFFNDTILPLLAIATIATSILIALSFMLGRAIANPKLTLWAKTEFLQLFVSVASVFFIFITINTFCAINMGEVASFFTDVTAVEEDLSVYGAAQEYLTEAALYSHNAMTVVRYHLEAYTVLSFLNAFMCDFALGPIGLGCLFGYSGSTVLPIGGYGAYVAALNIFYNSTIMAHFSALNFLFILLFVYKGLGPCLT